MVYRARAQALARARLSEDQHRQVRPGDFGELRLYLTQRRADADELAHALSEGTTQPCEYGVR
jgi:hypothetical protein